MVFMFYTGQGNGGELVSGGQRKRVQTGKMMFCTVSKDGGRFADSV